MDRNTTVLNRAASRPFFSPVGGPKRVFSSMVHGLESERVRIRGRDSRFIDVGGIGLLAAQFRRDAISQLAHGFDYESVAAIWFEAERRYDFVSQRNQVAVGSEWLA
ncbi:hypothetical protein [Bordetella avium]|uniref:hypothetical protein n=1 Tax=Bordetella avium TaxID=521 RepID=UPI000FD72313|nr:hypothetical protein [Bordetella avium]WQE33763.1 hypothetical protein U0029_00845 [Bordetella avium]